MLNASLQRQRTNKAVGKMISIKQVESPVKKILFLGYSQTQTKLIDVLIDNKCAVDHSQNSIGAIEGYDCVISYGYRHILKRNVIEGFRCPIFNLHVSYLPYNRGADPNFWSFYDNTPSGVTIHLIDGGVDTGPIVRQRYVNFKDSEDTFAKTYAVLKQSMEDLFLEFLPSLINDTWTAKKQRGVGTHHYRRDLPSNFSGWDANIMDEIERLHVEGLKYDC